VKYTSYKQRASRVAGGHLPVVGNHAGGFAAKVIFNVREAD
jgi:hypothetical protein